MIHTGDCVEVMAGMDAASVDAIVTDPPYGLEFMGKEWDRPWAVGFSQMGIEGHRNATPSFSSNRNPVCRTCHKHERGTKKCQCETPDFDETPRTSQIAFGYWSQRWATEAFRVAKPGAYLLAFGGTRTYHRMACAIEDAGWIIRDCLVWAYASGFPKSRALLKPAWEPIVMARKPGPLRELAIDACRIVVADDEPNRRTTPSVAEPGMFGVTGHNGTLTQGRWPANLILTDPIFDGDTPGVVGGGAQDSPGNYQRNGSRDWEFTSYGMATPEEQQGYGDSGTYSRFFLIPKADRAEREPVLGGLPRLERAKYGSVQDARPHTSEGYEYHREPRQNVHPTVKPLDLMRHLVRLVTPAGGTVLDPFLGSGTTALAAEMEGFAWIGIEKEPEYVRIAEARLNGTQRGLGLVTP